MVRKSQQQQDHDNLAEEVKRAEDELSKLNQEVQECTNHIDEIAETLHQERKEGFEVAAENKRLNEDIAAAVEDLAVFQREIESLKAPLETLRQQERSLLQELATDKEAAVKAHALANESAEAARRDAAVVRAQQEEQQSTWKAALKNREELLRQVEAGAQQRSQAVSERDLMRERWATTKEEVEKMREANKNLQADYTKLEERLAEEREKRARLEQEVEELSTKLEETEASRQLTEDQLKKKGGVLKETEGQLQRKKDMISKELGKFGKAFDEAMGVQEARDLPDPADKPTKSLLPRNFGQIGENLALQAERAYRDHRMRAAIELSDLECDVRDMEQRQQAHQEVIVRERRMSKASGFALPRA